MQSLVHRIRRNLLLVSCLAVAGMFCAWLGQVLFHNHGMIDQIRAEAMEQHRAQLQAGMKLAQSYITSETLTLHSRSESQLRSQLDLAWSLLENTVKTHPGVPRKELVKRVAETLRPLRYNNGSGYFFITGYDGIEVLYPPAPEKLEGKNMFKLDENTRAVVLAHDSIAKKHGEGFHRYLWSMPGQSGWNHPKTSFVRGHDELRITVGTGLYNSDILSEIKADVLSQLGKMHFGEDAYFFAGTWDGVSLLGPSKGKNMLHVRDKYGVPVVQRLIALSKAGGGFLEYHMPSEVTTTPTHKLSYVIGIPAWRWYIGIGRDIRNLKEATRIRESQENIQLYQIAAFSLGALLSLILLITFLSHKLSLGIAKDLHRFMDFFRHSGHKLEPMPVESLEHAELRQIAQYVNVMVDNLRKAQSERERILTTLETKNQELEHVLFIAGHDLRSPLVTIQGFTSELLQDIDILAQEISKDAHSIIAKERIQEIALERIPDSTGYIRSGINKLDYLLQGVLRYSRAGRIEPTNSLLNMDELLTECSRAMEFSLRSNNAVLEILPLPDCYGDNTLVQQIFTNLLENAIKYRHSERAPSIRITGHTQGTTTTYCVQDNGIGIPASELKNIFKLFARTQQKADIAGDGLGLAIAMRLVLRMNGHLWAESNLQSGSRFYIALPSQPTSQPHL